MCNYHGRDLLESGTGTTEWNPRDSPEQAAQLIYSLVLEACSAPEKYKDAVSPFSMPMLTPGQNPVYHVCWCTNKNLNRKESDRIMGHRLNYGKLVHERRISGVLLYMMTTMHLVR